MYKILAFAGSLRKDSYNKKLLQALIKQSENTVLEIEEFNISGIPLYNGDLESDNFPKVAQELKDKVVAADGILIVTPEYNWSVPGVVKNVIDWVSHPYGDNSWSKKPIAITGATNGWQGTLRSQTQLKSILLGIGAYVMPFPELLFSNAPERFDEQGQIKDQKDRKKLDGFLEGVANWVSKFK